MFSDYQAVAILELKKIIQIKSVFYSRKYVKARNECRAHLRCLAPRQHSMKKRRSGGDPVARLSLHILSGLQIESYLPHLCRYRYTNLRVIEQKIYSSIKCNENSIITVWYNMKVIAHKI